MKRCLYTNIITIILLICFCLFVVSCNAHPDVPINKEEKLSYEQEIIKVIEVCLKDGQEKIDIGEFKCDYDTLGEIVSLTILDNPLYSPCLIHYKTVSWFGLYVKYIIPDYTKMHIVEYIDAEANRIIATIDTDMSEVDKVIWINDYICNNYEYDTTLAQSNVYGMLKMGTGTCRAYVQMFNLLADKTGLNTSFAVSHKMRHAWNIVQIDGCWYNIDVTWNDQSKPYCYLSSDEAMLDFHCGMRETSDTIQFVKCNDKRYNRINLSRKKNEN